MGTSGSVRSGRLSGESTRAILGGSVPYAIDSQTGERRIPDTIYVYANNQDRVSQFRIEFGGASQQERESFLSRLSSGTNLSDRNSENSYLSALRDVRALRPDISDADARAVAEIARSNTAYNAIQRMLERDRGSASPRFPNISVTRPNRRRR